MQIFGVKHTEYVAFLNQISGFTTKAHWLIKNISSINVTTVQKNVFLDCLLKVLEGLVIHHQFIKSRIFFFFKSIFT